MHEMSEYFITKMEVAKWVMCDGKGNMTSVHTFSNPVLHNTKENIKIQPIEPKWKNEDPKNCFKPF